MNHHPASAGPDTGEFVALTLPIDEVMIRLRGKVREVEGLRVELEHLIMVVHETYHKGEGVAKPPSWEHCERSLCRQVRRVLFDE